MKTYSLFADHISQANAIRKDYILTDGDEIFAERHLTQAEADDLNEKAAKASGGSVWWEVKTEETEAEQ